jgi:hypothetical protein
MREVLEHGRDVVYYVIQDGNNLVIRSLTIADAQHN